MPYFVYRIQEKPRKLDHLETFPSYKEAKVYVREQRQQSNDVESIRMIFARNDIEAEKLLTAPREERVIGED
jgi:sulfur relay (sulfurtransferase) DsrF/TusC family protein